MVIRIGTRESELALWQANRVASLLNEKGFSTEIVTIKSEGDIDLTTPLYQMGVQGVFTRALDIALLQSKIDIAVHSMKDVPTQLAEGIMEAAVLERGNPLDLFVPNPAKFQEGREAEATEEELLNSLLVDEQTEFPFISGTVGTGSIRRRAQWLNRYPNQKIDELRGNVNTRLQKLEASEWSGAIFAAAGLERIEKRPAEGIELQWMLPAPAQGAVMVVCRAGDENVLQACRLINHRETAVCAKLERDFLAELLGGCSTPISAFAKFEQEHILFKGNIVSPDGKLRADIEERIEENEIEGAGKILAEKIKANGANEVIAAFTK